MSAYLVADKSLSVISRSVEHFANRKTQFGQSALWKAMDTYHNHFLTTASYGDIEAHMAGKLFTKLVKINMLSLLERYDDADTCWGGKAKAYSYDPYAPVVSMPVLIDLLDNWQYQACEGVTIETGFYRLTVEIQNKLAREYVQRTRPYTETVWGIDDYSELEGIPGALDF